jgi:hypothetical protein
VGDESNLTDLNGKCGRIIDGTTGQPMTSKQLAKLRDAFAVRVLNEDCPQKLDAILGTMRRASRRLGAGPN